MGRTGKMWGIEHEGVTPDIMVMAKGIASGMVLSAIGTRGHMMQKSPVSRGWGGRGGAVRRMQGRPLTLHLPFPPLFQPGSMGGTYGANAVSAAAAVATFDVMKEEKLPANAAARGVQLQAGLRAIAADFPGAIYDVRGRGCMVGLEFNAPPGSGLAGAVTAECMAEGLLLLTTGWRETIRFIPPLVVSEAEMDTALTMFRAGLKRALAASSVKLHHYGRGVA